MPQRRVLRLSGAEVRDFLQNLVTNDIAGLDTGLVYAALLTPQGKLISDFFLAADGADVLMDLPESQAATVLQRLTLYKLRADVTIAETALHVRRGLGPAPEGAFPDPRHPALGWRAIGAAPGSAPQIDWPALRVAHLIPEMGVDLDGESYILEAGFEALNGVDFRKGCYVGQEVTARMKHKTELRKGLARVRVEGEAGTGTPIEGETGKPVGTLLTRAGDEAIAYLRFDRAQGALKAGGATVTRL
ncbi:YgfZ/GcvT domain-containing protein [Poseidonocella sedimentorum]|uniref:CAF17-like 4Fe-4S cluster assembly/insertion protein YgfZ n=1 Tax=Poseidonocella sedimentorum TaxID=871652 RepID=UPI000B86E3C0|nr:folate-binding protein YgfZ [Poseidonocella sedimentorum]